MYQFNNGNLTYNFDGFFTRHQYGTCLASKSTFSLPKICTNYGKFNIKFFGPKTWNDINESLKSLSKLSFKRKLKQQVISGYDD